MKNARLLIDSGGAVAASALLTSLLSAQAPAEADLLRTDAGKAREAAAPEAAHPGAEASRKG
ncbi:hypothetical protein J0910_15450 [Nocardiopsis sp. CNT-189]|uniref:hypothetical protein n=1 Tax=Nocardiopsis oceanisediminis TaxID=2816862 RepID=UPI003B2A6BAD